MSETTIDVIDELFARPAEQGISLACLVVQGGAVVAERYGRQPGNDFQAEEVITSDSTVLSWSMAKSITHAAVGILVGDGMLDPNAPASVPEWEGTPKAAITLHHLLEMRSGLVFVEDHVGGDGVDGETSNCIEMLYLHDGVTNSGRGEQLLPPGWRDHAREVTAHDDESGFDYGPPLVGVAGVPRQPGMSRLRGTVRPGGAGSRPRPGLCRQDADRPQSRPHDAPGPHRPDAVSDAVNPSALVDRRESIVRRREVGRKCR